MQAAYDPSHRDVKLNVKLSCVVVALLSNVADGFGTRAHHCWLQRRLMAMSGNICRVEQGSSSLVSAAFISPRHMQTAMERLWTADQMLVAGVLSLC